MQLRQVTCEILISAAELMFLCMYALGVHSSFLLLVDIILFVYILKVREKVCFAGLGQGKT